MAKAAPSHVILRTTVTRGVTARGLWPEVDLTPTVMVSATPWNRSLMGKPVRLVTSATSTQSGVARAASLKSLGYLDNILAAREAAAKDADDALFLNASGKVACTTIANVFALHGRICRRRRFPPASIAGRHARRSCWRSPRRPASRRTSGASIRPSF